MTETEIFIRALEYIAAILGISGAILVALKKRKGFVCWIMGNIIWIVFGLLDRKYGLAAQFFAYEIISIFGYWNWRKE